MLIDSHCHLDRLDLSAHQGSLAAALDAARAAGVQQFLAVAVDLEDAFVYQDLESNITD